MDQNKKIDLFKKYWLTVLIAAQPVLDAVAYWVRSDSGTVVGYIRLCLLIALPLYLLLRLKKKKTFVISMAVIGVFCALHILNGFRVGYLNIYGDVSYMVRVIQTPVLAICFVYFIYDEEKRSAAEWGILLAAAIYAVLFAAANISGTANVTYGAGMGVSGWVIDDNRCANSVIMVILSCFAVYYSVRSDSKLINIIIPVCVGFLLIINGTKACYGGLFALLLGFAAFLLLNRLVNGERLKKTVLLTLAALSVAAVFVYPYTPRAKVDAAQSKAAEVNHIEMELTALGYDLKNMSVEERFNDPVVRGVFEHWYRKYMYSIPDLFDRFGADRVLMKYEMSSDMGLLINTRIMKLKYAQLIWEDTDNLTRLVGFEYPDQSKNPYDLENDWAAIFYYYGYIGTALYGCFIFYFLFLIGKRVIRDFKASLNLFNITILLCLVLMLGLAQFSGSMLRRPNVSVYFSLILALAYFRTADTKKVLSAWGDKG